MRTVGFFLPVFLVAMAFTPRAVSGQEGAFAFQVRGGMGFPQGEFGSGVSGFQGDTGRGATFTMGFTFPGPLPGGLFLGFGQRRFSCDDPMCPEGKDWVSTGFDVAWRKVFGEGRARYWLQGGLHTHRVEGRVLGEGGEVSRLLSDGGAGLEGGGGLLLGIGARASLSPGIFYGWGRVPFSGSRNMRLNYIYFDIGLVLGF